MKASLGAEAGITATAHKIARIFYALVKQQLEYDDAIWNRNDEERQRRRKESTTCGPQEEGSLEAGPRRRGVAVAPFGK
jgi:hypothetical protein